MNAATRLPELPFDVRAMNAAATGLFALAGVLVAALAVLAVARMPAFAIRQVSIDGDVGRNSPATLRAAAVSKLTGTLFTLNLAQAQAAFQSAPWVRRAVVRRVWPDRLAVTLEEHRAVAYWARDDGDDHLVNAQGEVFEANLGDVEDDNLPTLQGPDGSSAQMLEMLGRFEAVIAPLQARIERLSLSERGTWEADLDTGAHIAIGRGGPEELLARVERFVSTVSQVTARYPQRAAGQLIESADLRYRQGYALGLRGVATLPASAPAGRSPKN